MKKNSGILAVILLILTIFLVHSCRKKANYAIPVITTTAVTEISYTTAVSGGDITDDGGVIITARGVCWNTSAEPTITNSKTTESGVAGAFTSNLTGLTPGTAYYVRAYATNTIGTGYGNEVSFTTTQVAVPVLTTAEITSITQTTAVSGGSVTSDNGGSVTARGVCWSTAQNPTTSDSKTSDAGGTGNFTSNITGLTGNTTYYVRAYATNSAGTAYGSQVSFTTSPVVPTVTTTSASLITSTTATGGGNVTSDGGTAVTTRGVCWSTTSNPTIALSTKTTDGTGTGEFTSSITGLTASTTYYIRAYATNSLGTAYGSQKSFTTLANIPTITTSAITGITTTSAITGGNVASTGGAAITSRGVCWSTSPNPDISLSTKTTDCLSVMYETKAFTTLITGLTAGTTYFVKAYATNSVGTAYGEEISFTASSTDPAVTDIDGNIYRTVTIGTQVWMAENLKTTKYANGDLIGTTTPATLDIGSESKPKYQWAYGGDENNVAAYGRLYTWYTATDSRNICPTGWHLPGDPEWTILTTFLGGEETAGDKLKEPGKIHWKCPNTLTTNETGFTGLPGGFRYSFGEFIFMGTYGDFWSSTQKYSGTAFYYNLSYSLSSLSWGPSSEETGYSVRCIKDQFI